MSAKRNLPQRSFTEVTVLNLLAKYGSLKNIPQAELDAAGYELVNELGAVTLQKKGSPKIASKLAAKLAARYGIPESKFRASPQYLKRFSKLEASKGEDGEDGEDEEDDEAEAGVYDGMISIASRWRNYVATCTQHGLPEFRQIDLPHIEAKEHFARLNLKFDIWMDGIERLSLELENRQALSESERLRRLMTELRASFKDFIDHELLKPKACLEEARSRLKAATADPTNILEHVRSEADIRQLLSICLKRAEAKHALSSADFHAGLFHLKRVQSRLSSRQEHELGCYTFGLASKNPFTDLDIGNDGGCCIGIYLDDQAEFGEGFGAINMPRYLIDPATQFLEIHSPRRERIGMALLFAGVASNGDSVLIVNSLELNRKAEALAGLLSDTAHRWILDYAQAVGFTQVVVGNTDYNTGTQHGALANNQQLEEVEGIEKLDFLETPLYGDVFSNYPKVECVVKLDREILSGNILPVTEQFILFAGTKLQNVVGYPSTLAKIEPKPEFLDNQELRETKDDLRDFHARMSGHLSVGEDGKLPGACVLIPLLDMPITGSWHSMKYDYIKAATHAKWFVEVICWADNFIAPTITVNGDFCVYDYQMLSSMLLLLHHHDVHVDGHWLSWCEPKDLKNPPPVPTSYLKQLSPELAKQQELSGKIFGTLKFKDGSYVFVPYELMPLTYASLSS